MTRQEQRRLPDFILAGAMKCGTTTLHRFLDRHPGIFIPRPEIAFYDADDLRQHPDFHIFDGQRWFVPRLDRERDLYLDWYSSFFDGATAGQLLGEDSTTYVSSRNAARRIAEINPGARIVVLFRDPTQRAYSHYWHLLRSGRAIFDFEGSLQAMQETIVQRSLYLEGVRRFLDHLPREQLHFELFEVMVEDIPAAVRRVTRFVGADPELIDFGESGTNYNPALLPLFPRLQRWRNTVLRLRTRELYLHHLPEVPGPMTGLLGKAVDRAHSIVNPQVERRPPPMKEATAQFLDDHFRRENEGLSELIGIETERYWYGNAAG